MSTCTLAVCDESGCESEVILPENAEPPPIGWEINPDGQCFCPDHRPYRVAGWKPGARRETVDHPAHYGGASDPFEAIKVIDAWGLGFSLGNALKYIARAGRKGDALEDLRKARWYLNHEIELMEAPPRGPKP